MKSKISSLNAVRVLACIGILSYHMYLTYLGAWGVTVFFVLSGFLMGYNYMDRPVFENRLRLKDCVGFSLKKIGKLYPLHLLTFAVPFGLQLFGVLTHRAVEENFALKAVTNVLLLHSFCPEESWYFSFNAVSWYLSVSMILYLFFPLILRTMRRYRSKKDAWCAMLLALVLQPLLVLLLSKLIYGEKGITWLSYICPVVRLGDYVVGCNLAYLFMHREEKETSDAAAAEIFALALNIAAEYLYTRSLAPQIVRNSTLFIPGAALLIWCFACGRGYLSRVLTNRITDRISELSPILFLVHPVVIQLVSIVLDRLPLEYQLKRWCFLFGGLAAIAAVSLLYKELESKFRKKHAHE